MSFHNQLLGEMVSCQLEAAIRRESETEGIVGNPAVGDFLEERLFGPGALYHWHELLTRATGEALDSRHFLEAYVQS